AQAGHDRSDVMVHRLSPVHHHIATVTAAVARPGTGQWTGLRGRVRRMRHLGTAGLGMYSSGSAHSRQAVAGSELSVFPVSNVFHVLRVPAGLDGLRRHGCPTVPLTSRLWGDMSALSPGSDEAYDVELRAVTKRFGSLK